MSRTPSRTDNASPPARASRLQVALIEPEIPPNTGNIARLCAATFTPLHLVGKLGFRTDDKAVRRAGLDYWSEVDLHYHLNIEELYEALPECRFLYFTTKAERAYSGFRYAPDDCLVFGSETRGLPEELLLANWESCFDNPHAKQARTIAEPGDLRGDSALRSDEASIRCWIVDF